jgi:prepilin-type N-terminal cleavage/methylation domain-containing protein
MRINNHSHKTSSAGFSMVEVLTVLSLIGVLLMISVGVLSSRRNQKVLLQTGRQFANDIRATVELAKAQSSTFTVEVKDSGWNIYVESDDPPNGWQTDEKRIFSYYSPTGSVISNSPALPSQWNSPAELKAGDTFAIDALGIHAQRIIRFNYSKAPVYKSICVRLYDSGDADVYRNSGGSTWLIAPLG